MGEWRQSTWGEEISLEYGKGIRGYADCRGPYRVFGSNGPVGWADSPLTQGPGVILGRKGAYRGVRFSVEPFSVIDTAYYVRPKSHLDMRWLYYAIIFHKLGEIDDGSPIPSTTRSAVYVRDLSVPDIEEQKAIADVLSALDDKIELNRRMNETLEASARALFRDWFVDFGPVKAKMAHAKGEGRPPYLAPDLWSLFPDRMGNDGVPVGWSNFTVGDLVDQHTASINPAAHRDETFEHYSLPAFDKGGYPALDEGCAIKSNKTVVPENAVLLSKLNPEISRVWLPNPLALLRQVASTEFLAFVPKGGVFRSLVYGLFVDPSFRQIMEGMVTGTSKSHQRISPPALRSTQAMVGSPEIFDAFDALVEPLLQQMLAARAESRTLAETRDALLPKLMSGQIRVRDAEALVV